MKKLLCLALTLCLLTGFMVPVLAEGPGEDYWEQRAQEHYAAMRAVIAQFNRTHGGTGELSVAILSDEEIEETLATVVVTGRVTGATRAITLPVEVVWRAELRGNPTNGSALIQTQDITHVIICEGAQIEASGYAVEAINAISTRGGTVSGDVSASLFGMSDGVVTGNITANSVPMRGGTINGSIDAVGQVSLDGGVINASEINTGSFMAKESAVVNASVMRAQQLEIRENAHVIFDCVAGLNNASILIEPSATVSDFMNRVENYIWSVEDETGRTSTVYGTVTRESIQVWGDDATLHIDENATLTIECLVFRGAALIIDGTLVLPAGFDFSEWEGTVTGANAGSLEGAWPRDFDDWPRDIGYRANATQQPIHPPDTGEGSVLLFAVLLLMMLSGAGILVLQQKKLYKSLVLE